MTTHVEYYCSECDEYIMGHSLRIGDKCPYCAGHVTEIEIKVKNKEGEV